MVGQRKWGDGLISLSKPQKHLRLKFTLQYDTVYGIMHTHITKDQPIIYHIARSKVYRKKGRDFARSKSRKVRREE